MKRNVDHPNIIVLIPDGETDFALSVVNCLSDVPNIKIHIISANAVNEIKYSNRIESFIFYNKTENEIDLISFIEQMVEEKEINVLMPLRVSIIRLISKYKAIFERQGLSILTSSVSNIDLANNKRELSKLLTDYEIPGPKVVGINYEISNLAFPILFKPIEDGGGCGIKKINNQNELDLKLKATYDNNFLLQEYIRGYDIDCSILSVDGKILAYTIQRGYLFPSKPYAPSLAVEFVKNEKLFNHIEKLIKILDWTGIAHIDLRYDESDNDYKVIEINPRFWNSVEASQRVGVNFPYLYCLTALGIPFELPTYRFESYTNNRGLIKILKSKLNISAKRRIKIPKNLAITSDFSDPLPKTFKYSDKILKKIKA